MNQTKKLSTAKYSTTDKNVCRPITRDEIKVALKNVYASESKPVQVGSVKTRTTWALILIIIGTIIISGLFMVKYTELETAQILFGVALLFVAFLIGIEISTKNIRKIYQSMSRFKNPNTPAYRRVFTKSKWQSQAIVYATLICLIFLGAQSINFFVIVNNPQTPADESPNAEMFIISGSKITVVDVTTLSTDTIAGQTYMNIQVKINNSINYYSEDLILEVRSYFAGAEVDNVNVTLAEPNVNDFKLKVKIHEPDDTFFLVSLIHRQGEEEQELHTFKIPSEKHVYIAKAEGELVSKSFPLTKSVDITIQVYNGGLTSLEPETLTLIITSPSLSRPFYREVENNATILYNTFWEYSFSVDNILDDDWVFDVHLKVDDETKDEALVASS